MSDSKKDISVVVLCYKAGEFAATYADQVKKPLIERGLSYELILVANYNKSERDSDSTPQVVREIASEDSNIIVVSEEKKGMYGFDVRSGLKMATGASIAYIDGDGQMPAEDVARAHDLLISSRADMAMTYRVKRQDGVERIFISKIYNAFLKTLFPKVSVKDANAKPKIFTREAFSKLDLHSNDWFIDAEIVIQATKNRFVIAELPTVFRKNEFRPSFVKFKTLGEFIVNLIRYRLRSFSL